MSETEIVRVPCSRCDQLHEAPKSVYQNQDGETYCDECLVPFECEKCGERRFTVPEKVSKNKTLTCRHCVDSEREAQKGSQRSSFWGLAGKLGNFWLLSMARFLSVILVLGTLNLIYEVLIFMANTPLTELELVGTLALTMVGIWIALSIADSCWRWKPS